MSEFLNNFGSSIFALLMLITTLTVPIFQKKTEYNIQYKKENELRYRKAYEDLMDNLYEFIKAFNHLKQLIEAINDKPTTVDYDGLNYEYLEFLRINIKYPVDGAFKSYIRSLDIHDEIGDELHKCVVQMRKTIKLLTRYDSEEIDNIVDSLNEIHDSFTNAYVNLKSKIKNLIH